MDTLSRNQILEALQGLARELEGGGEPHELVIAGGAALVVLYGARQSTKDIDAVLSDPQVFRAARNVADQLGLPEDWLNDGAKGYLCGLERGEMILDAPSLTVWTLATPQLLAMKLSAWRDDLDIDDARLLLSKLAGDREDIWRRIEHFLLPGRELKARYAFEDLWESEHGPATID